MEHSRPPALDVGDDSVVRRDWEQEIVRHTYPKIHKCRTPAERNNLCRENDKEAYDSIKRQFPHFRPHTVSPTAKRSVSATKSWCCWPRRGTPESARAPSRRTLDT